MGHQVEIHSIHSMLDQVALGKELREANQEDMAHQEAAVDQGRQVVLTPVAV